jgi:hypothetical protein
VSSFFARPENGTQYVPVGRPQSGAIAACIYVRFDIMRTRFSTEQHVMNLKSMSIDALIGLRGKIDSVLGSKVAGERRALETELAKLSRFESGGSGKSWRNLGRTRSETTVVGRRHQVRKETGRFSHCRIRQGRRGETSEEKGSCQAQVIAYVIAQPALVAAAKARNCEFCIKARQAAAN